MVPTLVQEPLAPDAPFRFVGGDASLDFVNTADWTPRGLERDRLTSYGRLLEWARGANLLDAADARRMTQAAGKHPRHGATALEAAHDVRDVLQEVFASVASGRPGPKALERFNSLLRDVAPHIRVVRDADGKLGRGWSAFGETAESIVWPIVWRAGDLLASPDADKLRMCAGVDCGWMYVDRSRNGLRRWCEMSVCGTAEKNRRRSSR